MLDALVSLPIISFLFLPLFTSWSTNLNIMLLYTHWATLVMSYPPLRVELVGTLLVRFLFYVFPALLFFAFDCAFSSLAVSIKAQGDLALPGRYGRKKALGVLGVAVGNVLLGALCQVGVEVSVGKLGLRSVLRVSLWLPGLWALGRDTLYCYVVRNISAYYIHRYVLHTRNSPLATLHREWHHSIHAPFSLSATYDHPLAYLVGHFMPTLLPALIFRPHVLSHHLFMGLVSFEDLMTYAGYSVAPTNIVLAGMARRTDAHMMTKGMGNYNAWGVLDWAHGTSVGGDVMEDLKAEAEKKDLKGKTGRAIEGAGNALDDAGEKIKRKGRGKKT